MTRQSNDELYTMTMEIHVSTAKAFLVSVPGGDKDRDGIWLPKSQLQNMERNGKLLNFDIPARLVEEKGLDGLVE